LLALLVCAGCGSSSAGDLDGDAPMASAGTSAGGSAPGPGSAGAPPTAGAPSATGGSPGSAGSSGGGVPGSAGSAGMPQGAAAIGNVACAEWPSAGDTEPVDTTIDVADSFDGGMKRFVGEGDLGSTGQEEGQRPLFELDEGALLENVIIGSPAADGIHCRASCTLRNVWWEAVGEDAATLNGEEGSPQMLVECGGAQSASDKVFQHNGAGTIVIKDFTALGFDKLYRSCGDCDPQHERHVELENVTAMNGGVLAGINENYGDTAVFKNVAVDRSVEICERYIGNDSGDEPQSSGLGADPEHCLYQQSDIHTFL
jgi:hypothetical protein